MEVMRKMAGAGTRQLKSLREAHVLEACLHLVKHAALDSVLTTRAVTLLRESAEWDNTCR